MIPDDLRMTAGFLLGALTGTIGGGALVALRAMESRGRAEARAFLAGRNCERMTHGEELLVPPPHLDEASLTPTGRGR